MAFVQANDTFEEKRRERQRALMSTGLENIAKGYASYEKAKIEEAKLAAIAEREKRKAVREDMNFVVTMNKAMGTDVDPFTGAQLMDPEGAQKRRREALKGKMSQEQSIDEQFDREERAGYDQDFQKESGFGPADMKRRSWLEKTFSSDEIPAEDRASDFYYRGTDRMENESAERLREMQGRYGAEIEAVPREPDYEGLQGLFKGAMNRKPQGGGKEYFDLRNKQEILKKRERENDPAWREEERVRKQKDAFARIEAMEKARVRAESRAEQDRIDGEIRREKDKIQEEGRKVIREKEEVLAKNDLQLRDIGEIRNKLEKLGEIGPFADKWENLKGMWRAKDPKWVALASEVYRTVTPIIHEYAGASQTEGEKKGLYGFLPDLETDNSDGMRIKLDGLEKYIQRKRESNFDFIIKNRSEKENKRRLDELNKKSLKKGK